MAVVGPSGSGKTTLLSILGGMLAPTSGQVILESDSIYDLSVRARTRLRGSRIGFIFQTFNLVPYLTALENVQAPLYLMGLSAKEQAERAQQMLERVGLAERAAPSPVRTERGPAAAGRTGANAGERSGTDSRR